MSENTMFFQEYNVLCSRGKKRCLNFSGKINKLFDSYAQNCWCISNMSHTEQTCCVHLCVNLDSFSVLKVFSSIGIPHKIRVEFQRIYLLIYVFFFFRVFLRAINKFAETMNQKFLENMNFEVQVSIKVFGWAEVAHVF